MNKELLLKVADAIEAHPEHFDMDNWFQRTDCGTTACIAGWAWHLHNETQGLDKAQASWRKNTNPLKKLCKILDVKYSTSALTAFDKLASVASWTNESLKNRYQTLKQPKRRAKVAAEYVRWFVETCGEGK